MAATAAERARNTEIREWAVSAGWPDLPARGRLPADVVKAWEDFTGQAAAAPEGDPEADPPETAELDDSDLDSELDAMAGPEPGSGPPVIDTDAPAPPANLDEARQRAAKATPPPHLAGANRRGRRGRKPKADAQPETPPDEIKI